MHPTADRRAVIAPAAETIALPRPHARLIRRVLCELAAYADAPTHAQLRALISALRPA
jgi:hypothetical protein